MMLKVNGEYLDFNGDIEIEKKIKLFEDISTTDGDMSFAFDLELTSHNMMALGIPLPDSVSKTVYQENECIVQNSAGITVNNGSLRIESVSGRFASCSFLGGNSNWFAILSGDMSELRLSAYDVDQNETEIVNSWSNDSGIVFPFVDLGSLITRGNEVARDEDFVGCFYLHTLFRETFTQSGVKIQGDLLDDPIFKQIIIATNTRSIVDKNANTIFAGTDTPVSIPSPTIPFVKIPLPLTTFPFNVGSDITSVSDSDFYLSAKMTVTISVSVTTVPGAVGPLNVGYYVNDLILPIGSYTTLSSVYSGNVVVGFTYTLTERITIQEGDYVSLFVYNNFGSPTTMASASLRLNPDLIFKAFGRSCIPLWTKQKFISNVLKMFNVITSYDQYTKTLTLDIFEKIKTKESIDLSDYVTVDTIDYSEFISNYAKVNNLKYQDGSDEDLEEYNISSFVRYGAGTITSNNYFVEQSADIVELDFTSPISYINKGFNSSIERINFVELNEGEDTLDITSVSNSGGIPQFNITDADDFFQVGDLARIETTTYKGDFTVMTVTSTYIEVVALVYRGGSHGTAIKLIYELTNDDSVYLFINAKSVDSNDYFDTDEIYLNQTPYSEWNLSFFNLLGIGRQVENIYKQSLSFGRPGDILSFQRTLIDRYWQQFGRILNDPVKPFCSGYLPWKVYDSINFLNPITIRTLETSNQYYCNRITGYKDSSEPCEIELIKLP